jgi:proteic killer suppression protein
MIVSFRHKGLKRLYETGDRSKVPAALAERIVLALAMLDEAVTVEEMNRPGFRLHQLRGDLKGFWSITVSANWRITFRFDGGSASDVNFVDYH